MMQDDFSARTMDWYLACFGPVRQGDRVERVHRFLEEALELAQAQDCTKEDAHALVEYVYSRPKGDIGNEVGGVMITLAVLCEIAEVSMHKAGEEELARNWKRMDAIRAKRRDKPAGSPLPQ